MTARERPCTACLGWAKGFRCGRCGKTVKDEPHEVSDEVAPECPVCAAGFGLELGRLRGVIHYRCRNCGDTWGQNE